MDLSTFIGFLGYLCSSTAMILSAVLVLLTLLLHFHPAGAIAKLTRSLTLLQTFLLTAAVLVLAVLLQLGAYEYETVFNAVENSMPPFQRLGGLWSGQASSLLFWSFLLSLATSIAMLIGRNNTNEGTTKTILLVLQITLLFFLIPDNLFTNPFNKTWMLPSGEIVASFFPPNDALLAVAADGQGMNPGLRHIAMLLHPPALYLGLIGFFIPYAFFINALLRGKDIFAWVRKSFPIVVASWFFLTLGMLLGSWWAYTIQGWGGYWGWDAVEISGLLPWLLSFGLIHSMRMHLRGFDYRCWIAFYTLAIVHSTLFGILITRSGLLDSIHAYTSGAMGPALTALILLHIAAAVVLMVTRRNAIFKQPATSKTNQTDKIIRLFNICLVILVLICLIGQTFPLTSQLLLPQSQSFSIQDYERWTAPFFLLLILLTALCVWDDKSQSKRWLFITVAVSALPPLVLLFRTSISLYAALGFWSVAFLLLSWLGSLLRDFLLPRITHKKSHVRLPVIMIHLGLAIIACGILGVETLASEYEGLLLPGSPVEIADCELQANALRETLDTNGNVIFELPLQLSCASKTTILHPAIIHYTKLGTMTTQPGLDYGWLQDTQIILENISTGTDQACQLRIRFFPLMSWIWAGGGLMASGAFLGFFHKKKKAK